MNLRSLHVLAAPVAVAVCLTGTVPATAAGVGPPPTPGWQAKSATQGWSQRAAVVALTDGSRQRSWAALGRLPAPTPTSPDGAGGDAAVLTGPIETAPFRVAGLSWDGDTDFASGAEIHLRVREEGVWSQWLETPAERAVDGGGRYGTAPFVTGGADAVQVHISGRSADLPADLDLNVITAEPDATSTTTTTSVAPVLLAQTAAPRTTVVSTQAFAAAAASVAQPAIVDRVGWGADESLRGGFVATTAELRAAVVHHTAGTNSYTAGQSAQIVRDIYYLHAITNGWGDVGYNFLVDKFGTVFEGRYGSIAAPDGQMRVGAHAQGYNTYSLGIAAMGDYSSLAADQRILDSMRDVIAWRFASTPTLDMATQAYFPANAYHADRYLPRIVGHRDVLATVCPGDDIHGRIPALITAVSQAMGVAPPAANTAPVANAGADKTARVGSTVTLTGTGTDADQDQLTYRWEQTGGAPTVALANPGTPQASFTAPAVPAGKKSLSLTFTLTVTDPKGATGSDSVVVKVVKR